MISPTLDLFLFNSYLRYTWLERGKSQSNHQGVCVIGLDSCKRINLLLYLMLILNFFYLSLILKIVIDIEKLNLCLILTDNEN